MFEKGANTHFLKQTSLCYYHLQDHLVALSEGMNNTILLSTLKNLNFNLSELIFRLEISLSFV